MYRKVDVSMMLNSRSMNSHHLEVAA